MEQTIVIENVDTSQELDVLNTNEFLNTDYNQLNNKPRINEQELIGNTVIDKNFVGLGAVDNTSDEDKPISSATNEALNTKVDKIDGKGLSTEDFTNELKTKLDNIEAGAEVNNISDEAVDDLTDGGATTLHKHSYNNLDDLPTIPSKLSDLADDSTHRTVTDAEKSTWNSKQDELVFTPENTANKGVSLGYCGLDSGGKVPLVNLPGTILKYKEVWNASTNIPTLTSPDTTKVGNVYIVSMAGTIFGIDWKLGDWLIYNEFGVPQISPNSDEVVSVNNKTGTVVLNTDDLLDSASKRFVSDTEKTTWNGKQDVINVLEYSVPFRNASGTGQTNSSLGVTSTSATAGSLARRTSAGEIFTATATNDGHAINRGQMNTALSYFQTKTTLDATLLLGTKYELGELTGNISMALTTPSGATNQKIMVKFDCGSTPYTFTITGTNYTTFSLTPLANTNYEVEFEYNAVKSKWIPSTFSCLL